MSRVPNLSKLRQERMKEVSLRVSSSFSAHVCPVSAACWGHVTETFRAGSHFWTSGACVTRPCFTSSFCQNRQETAARTSRSVSSLWN